MDIKILNQYTHVWEVDNHVQKNVFRTHETLEQLKERLDLNGYVTDGEWKYNGVVTCVHGILNSSQGSLSKAFEFNEKPFGDEGYHTLDEILESDLAWVKGYGVIDDKEDFKTKFEGAAQKKVASPFDSVFTSSEAESKWGLKPGTVRSAITRGKLKKYVGTGIKQTDKTWLIMAWVMEKEYGENN